MNTAAINHDLEERLCLACGFCCDGTLFTRVQLQPGESIESLKSAGLSIRQDNEEQWIMQQPCSGYQQGQCQTYQCRPVRCGKFRCTLLQQVETRLYSEEEALKIIQDTKQTRDQLAAELYKIFPGFRTKAMAENLRRLRKESRKLAGERLKLFRAARKQISQLKKQLTSDLDTYFYVPDESAPEQEPTHSKD